MISESDLVLFERSGFVALKSFLSADAVTEILSEMKQLEDSGMFRDAAIGKGQSEHVNSKQRGDKIHWIDVDNPSPAVSIYIDKIQELKQVLNRTFYLGLDYFECHYAEYPPGGFYKRHSDKHQAGSTRILSLVLYLNTKWKPGDGGELVIYGDGNSGTKVEPIAGNLVVFLSEIEHEVLATQTMRRSITGWIHNRE